MKYIVTVTHEPYTLKRLSAPKTFEHESYDAAQDQVSKLRKTGLKNHQIQVVLSEGETA